MATATINGQLNGTDQLDNQVKDEDSSKSENSLENDIASLKISSNEFKNPSGFSLPQLYKYSLQFYKEKSGKAVHLSYGDKCKLVALNQQVSQGPFNPATAEPLGTFDVIGRDRRLAWQNLGSIDKQESMKQFANMLDQLTPTYGPFIEAVWADHLEKQRLKEEEDERKLEEEEELKRLEEEKQIQEQEQVKQEETKRQIQDALNQQTFSQFKLYAEQQYPGNPDEQGVLIRQLQEQHYLQYMQQVYQQRTILQDTDGQEDLDEEPSEEKSETEEISDERRSISETEVPYDEETDGTVKAASMWTSKDMKEFKESIRQEGGDAVIKVGHGETVTVRVPTHQDGNCLFWEFATDFYDIGFGIHFEWTTDSSNVVSIHITETDDDDDDDEDEDELITADDIERLGGIQSPPKPPQSVIIPVYRRDCHEEVYAGSHPYPGQGVYLLKFDNSYSLWRSKMLYYRVYYTR